MPEPTDVHVHGAAVPRHSPAVSRGFMAVPGGFTVPDLVDEVGAAEHRGRVRAEEGQQLELLERQLDLVTVGPGEALFRSTIMRCGPRGGGA